MNEPTKGEEKVYQIIFFRKNPFTPGVGTNGTAPAVSSENNPAPKTDGDNLPKQNEDKNKQ